MIEIGIENIGDGAHRDVNFLIIILALQLCHFILMELEDIGLEFFGTGQDSCIVTAKRYEKLESFNYPLQIRNTDFPDLLYWIFEC